VRTVSFKVPYNANTVLTERGPNRFSSTTIPNAFLLQPPGSQCIRHAKSSWRGVHSLDIDVLQKCTFSGLEIFCMRTRAQLNAAYIQGDTESDGSPNRQLERRDHFLWNPITVSTRPTGNSSRVLHSVRYTKRAYHSLREVLTRFAGNELITGKAVS
jgi:hypothetical protein